MWIGIGIAAVVIVGYILIYNNLHKLQIKIEESSSGIDVALEKRYDMLSEELEAVKKFLRHEQETYTAVASVRSGKEINEQTLQQQSQLSEEAVRTINRQIEEQSANMAHIKQQMSKNLFSRINPSGGGASAAENPLNQKVALLAAIHRDLGGVGSVINALAEQYPTLYSKDSMEHFQRSIFNTEEHLQAARRLYNSNVSVYNQKIVTIPYVVVAKIHGMKKAAFYEVEDKKRSFKVNFD